MSLWYDIKNKIYSSGPMDNWYVNYLKKCCNTLSDSVNSMLSQHVLGTSGRHRTEHIEYEENLNLRDVIDAESISRHEGDLRIMTNVEAYLDNERKARNESLSKIPGEKVYGKSFSSIIQSPDVNPTLVPTDELCAVGSEIFNDYSFNQAKGQYSHAEGQYTSAYGDHSHTEGIYTSANGMCSHAEGENTIASGNNQHVQGILNIEDVENKYAHIVGNGHYGIENNAPVRSNGHTLDCEGNAWYAGDVICGDAKSGLQAQITDLYNLRPTVLTEISDSLSLNTIYDLNQCETLSLNIPDGNVGDWIKVDFISGETPTELSIVTEKINDFSLIPESNTAYTLIFDWGKLTADTYGWRFSYSEYTKAVTE